MVFCPWQFERVSHLLLPLFVSTYDEHTDSPHREALNKGITKIQANGVLDSIREKWIRYSDRNCEKVNKLFLFNLNLISFTQVTQSQLTLHNIGGCFIILAVGVCLALLNSILSIFSKNRKGFNKKFWCTRIMMHNSKYSVLPCGLAWGACTVSWRRLSCGRSRCTARACTRCGLCACDPPDPGSLDTAYCTVCTHWTSCCSPQSSSWCIHSVSSSWVASLVEWSFWVAPSSSWSRWRRPRWSPCRPHWWSSCPRLYCSRLGSSARWCWLPSLGQDLTWGQKPETTEHQRVATQNKDSPLNTKLI